MGVGFASVLSVLEVDGAARSSTNAWVGLCYGLFINTGISYGFVGFIYLVAVEVE